MFLAGRLALLLISSTVVLYAGTVVDFESFSDGDLLTTQIPGVIFSNAVALSVFSLNTAEFPPYSGVNVASDSGGPITISFLSPVFDVSGYFTYSEPLTVSAFDAFNTLVATASSSFSNNEGLSGDLGSNPNEFLQVVSPGPPSISSVTIAADPSGSSLTLDDLTFDDTSSVPEPETLTLLAIGAFLLALRRWSRIPRA